MKLDSFLPKMDNWDSFLFGGLVVGLLYSESTFWRVVAAILIVWDIARVAYHSNWYASRRDHTGDAE